MSGRFSFDSVAPHFDDMAVRSIPGYTAMLATVPHIARTAPPGEAWDLGVSTGNMLVALSMAPGLTLCGCDVSQSMIDQARTKAPGARLVVHDLHDGVPFEAASVVVFGWTLQFIESQEVRCALLTEAFNRLAPGGFMFVMEKFAGPRQLEDAYYAWRRGNGYSQAEIDAKSAALRSVMHPWRFGDLMGHLVTLGGETRVLYRLFNFGGVAIRKPSD